MRICASMGLICALRWTTYQNVQWVQNGMKKNNHYLCLWATGVRMSGRTISNLKSSISQKAYTLSRDCGQVGASWWGGNMHLGYDRTAAKYGCHSKAGGSLKVQLQKEDQGNQILKKQSWMPKISQEPAEFELGYVLYSAAHTVISSDN